MVGAGQGAWHEGASARRFLIGGLSLVIALSLLTAGCISARLLMGTRPNPELLETSLRVGESTRADVLRVLGQPYGKGMSGLPIDGPKPKTVWSYYYEEGTIESNAVKDSRRMFLWIYFDGDRYDGYMWFSSLPK